MLARTPNGNLLAVYRAVIERAEHFINTIVENQNPIDAEITEGMADWYLVRTFPGDDIRAMRWLARRRFGVFQPMQQRHANRNDHRLVQGFEPVFPGWLFVFCWDIKKMRARIRSCPGVMQILCDPATDKPVPIEETFIDRLRALNWVYDENAPHPRHYTVKASRNVKRIKPKCQKINKRTKITLKKLKNALKAKGKWEPSTWEGANELAPHERIALMLKTLNAPSIG